MEIRPAMRVIEVGHIVYTPRLQRTPLGTEAQYLLAKYVFETLGYRRYEWKCNALNAPSRRAALRYGFTFEGIFRQHLISKGRNRDTAWYSILDSEWPARKAAFERWLAPDNFDAHGRQKVSLSALNGNARDRAAAGDAATILSAVTALQQRGLCEEPRDPRRRAAAADGGLREKSFRITRSIWRSGTARSTAC